MQKNITKKALSVLLALTMIMGMFSMISFSSSAAENTNLATGKTATADSSETNDFTAPKTVDGSDSTRWASAAANAP